MTVQITPVQIPLAINLAVDAVFPNFIEGENGLIVNLLQSGVKKIAQQKDPDDKQLLIWGDTAVGKTFLLQATCNFAHQHGVSSCYLPLKQYSDLSSELLSGLEQLQLVCIDDVDSMECEDNWEKALFNLINECRHSGTLLVLSASSPVHALSVKLPDLKSRMGWGATFQLQQLSDEQKASWLKNYANQQGLELQNDVVNYLMSHQKRDMHYLVKLVKFLDYASMSKQRKLTLPFVKSEIKHEL